MSDPEAPKAPPRAPSGLLTSGKRLWRAVQSSWDLDSHEEQMLLESCRCADRLDALDGIIRSQGVTLPDGRVHPAVTEARQQQLVLARLVASLRLPEGLEDDVLIRPQRRGAVRRPYSPRNVT